MDLFPFTQKTIVSLGIIALTFVVFYFWNFSFHPILNIVLKSVLIALFYWFLNFKFKTSDDINGVIKGVLKKVWR